MAIPAGRYYIVCNTISHLWGTLALQYKDKDASVTLVPFGSERGTLWNISGPDESELQAISPDGYPNLQAVSVDCVIRALKSAKQGWAIEVTKGSCTISDGTASWQVQLVVQEDGMPSPTPGGKITTGLYSDNMARQWWCLPVPT